MVNIRRRQAPSPDQNVVTRVARAMTTTNVKDGKGRGDVKMTSGWTPYRRPQKTEMTNDNFND